MLELIFDREGIPLVDFLISQYDFGLRGGGGERVLHPPHQGELCIQYISKSIIYINKHREWVRQPSKKYLVCITLPSVFSGLKTLRILVGGSECPYITSP